MYIIASFHWGQLPRQLPQCLIASYAPDEWCRHRDYLDYAERVVIDWFGWYSSNSSSAQPGTHYRTGRRSSHSTGEQKSSQYHIFPSLCCCLSPRLYKYLCTFFGLFTYFIMNSFTTPCQLCQELSSPSRRWAWGAERRLSASLASQTI